MTPSNLPPSGTRRDANLIPWRLKETTSAALPTLHGLGNGAHGHPARLRTSVNPRDARQEAYDLRE